MRKLDPKTRLAPRDDVNVSRWNPTTFSLQVNRSSVWLAEKADWLLEPGSELPG